MHLSIDFLHISKQVIHAYCLISRTLMLSINGLNLWTADTIPLQIKAQELPLTLVFSSFLLRSKNIISNWFSVYQELSDYFKSSWKTYTISRFLPVFPNNNNNNNKLFLTRDAISYPEHPSCMWKKRKWNVKNKW